jgi:hypothetical protein
MKCPIREFWVGLFALSVLLAGWAVPASPSLTPAKTPTPEPVPPPSTPVVVPSPSSIATSTPPPTVTPSAEWEVVWSDEFEAPDGSGPGPEGWSFNTGGGGWGNAERQYHTDRSENVVVEDGALLICVREEEYYNGFRYTSARLVTKNRRWASHCGASASVWAIVA